VEHSFSSGLTIFYGTCEDAWWSAYELNSKIGDASDYMPFPQSDSVHPFKRVSACSIFLNSGAECARRFFAQWARGDNLHVALVKRSSPFLPELKHDWVRDEVYDSWPIAELEREASVAPCLGRVGLKKGSLTKKQYEKLRKKESEKLRKNESEKGHGGHRTGNTTHSNTTK